MAKKVKKRSLVSLFSGAMGLDLGLEHSGFAIHLVNELDKDSVQTIRENRPDLAVFDSSVAELNKEIIRNETGLEVGELDLLAGGPPCQPFSVFGNRGGTSDERGQMVYEFVRLVGELKPKTFLMENVRGLLSMPAFKKGDTQAGISVELTKPGSLVQLLFDKFNELGYRVDLYVVNSANYGAPQIRERVLLIGNRFGLKSSFPEPRFSNRAEDNLPPFATLGDAIGGDFRDPYPEVLNFSPRKLKYLEMVPPGGNWRSLPEEIQKESMGKSWFLKGGRSAYWRKLSYEFPSPTVVTMPNHAGTSMCHPDELRAISVGEAMAIQEFPLDWKLSGSTASKFRQIGNAVPLALGKVAGEAIQELLTRIDSGVTGELGLQNDIRHIRPHIRTKSYFRAGEAFAGETGYYDRRESPDPNRLF